jgi:hypothetical protein
MANQTSNPAEAGSVDKRTSTQKKHFMIYGIAAAVIVLVCLGAWYLRATEQAKAKANFDLGLAYEKGLGVQQDLAQAVSLFRKAANQGNADAQFRLGVMYANGLGGLAKDDAQAVSLFRKAAEQKNAYAEFILGAAYDSGQFGLTKDDALAVSWWRKAAEQGNAYAEYWLGVKYANGLGGLTKDYAQAVSWWRKAADQGEVDAEYLLGGSYANGLGGLTRDDAQALSWLQKAADQGYALAKDAIANVHARQQQEQQYPSSTESQSASPTLSPVTGAPPPLDFENGIAIGIPRTRMSEQPEAWDIDFDGLGEVVVACNGGMAVKNREMVEPFRRGDCGSGLQAGVPVRFHFIPNDTLRFLYTIPEEFQSPSPANVYYWQAGNVFRVDNSSEPLGRGLSEALGSATATTFFGGRVPGFLFIDTRTQQQVNLICGGVNLVDQTNTRFERIGLHIRGQGCIPLDKMGSVSLIVAGNGDMYYFGGRKEGDWSRHSNYSWVTPTVSR